MRCCSLAFDANILIFERMKEELRRGRRLRTAIEIGFTRAWPSIRDGQLSTIIICAILFFFGTNFGASIVKGFAITLAIPKLRKGEFVYVRAQQADGGMAWSSPIYAR